MRIFAVLSNLAFLVFIIFIIAQSSNSTKASDIIGPLVFLLFAVLNIVALLGKGRDFLSLYFERKKLEQQLKINELLSHSRENEKG